MKLAPFDFFKLSETEMENFEILTFNNLYRVNSNSLEDNGASHVASLKKGKLKNFKLVHFCI